MGAVSIRLDQADAHLAAGRVDEAIAAYTGLIQADPRAAVAWSRLGRAIRWKGDVLSALRAQRQAIELDPFLPEAQLELGLTLDGLERYGEAAEAYRTAAALEPGLLAAHYNLGNALTSLGELEGAVAVYRHALPLAPRSAPVVSNLANALHRSARYEEAMALYREAVALDPGNAQVHYNLALALLQRGDYAEGWQEFEWRLQLPHAAALPPGLGEVPRWAGEALAGKTVLMLAEQGLGDTVQFCRYLPMVAAQNPARVYLRAPAALHPLLERLPFGLTLFSDQEPTPSVDFYCPLMSLASRFQTTLSTIPAPARFGGALSAAQGGPSGMRLRRVGLCWAGRREHQFDLQRSISLSAFAPFAELHERGGVEFQSLQKGPAATQVLTAFAGGGGFPITPLARGATLVDTAALIASLDVVVTVDTVIAHLAGSMGKATHVLLPFAPDWRWLTAQSHPTESPWYPAVRLHRQASPKDWSGPIGGVACQLRELFSR